MPDAYSYAREDAETRRPPPRRRPLRLLLPLLAIAGLAYLLVLAPGAPLASLGDRVRGTLSDVTDGLVGGDAAGTPDEILARWEAEFGVGDEAFETAGPTAAMLFRNNLRGLRNAVRRDEREKIRSWREGIEKNFEAGRAWRTAPAGSPADDEGP